MSPRRSTHCPLFILIPGVQDSRQILRREKCRTNLRSTPRFNFDLTLSVFLRLSINLLFRDSSSRKISHPFRKKETRFSYAFKYDEFEMVFFPLNVTRVLLRNLRIYTNDRFSNNTRESFTRAHPVAKLEAILPRNCAVEEIHRS